MAAERHRNEAEGIISRAMRAEYYSAALIEAIAEALAERDRRIEVLQDQLCGHLGRH